LIAPLIFLDSGVDAVIKVVLELVVGLKRAFLHGVFVAQFVL
jgi:hypothetical protein